MDEQFQAFKSQSEQEIESVNKNWREGVSEAARKTEVWVVMNK